MVKEVSYQHNLLWYYIWLTISTIMPYNDICCNQVQSRELILNDVSIYIMSTITPPLFKYHHLGTIFWLLRNTTTPILTQQLFSGNLCKCTQFLIRLWINNYLCTTYSDQVSILVHLAKEVKQCNVFKYILLLPSLFLLLC